jgi:ACS family tartrate transporter-like MFS transporter
MSSNSATLTNYDEVVHRKTLIGKVALRIIPILMLCYFTAFLDRVNIGFASLTMMKDLRLTPAEFGIGAGIFFLSYCLCEVPSNLILARVGARPWIARIMISWGIASALTGFVTGAHSFYAVRVLLGAAEAGFFPGVVFYLTTWFPRDDRARMVAWVNASLPIASVIGAPVSVLILQYWNNVAGVAGWQWLFVLEAIPAIVLGVVVLWLLPDRSNHASWLTVDEKRWLGDTLAREQAGREAEERLGVLAALTDRRVLLMGFLAAGATIAATGVAIWMPQIVKAFGLSTMQTGFITAIPSLALAVSMVASAMHADRTDERVWHVAGPLFVSAAGFLLAASTRSPVVGVIGLTIGNAGVGAAVPNLWVFPTVLLTGTAAAAGIALINAIGSIGGFFGPVMIGWFWGVTGSFAGALTFVAAVCVMAALTALLLGKMMWPVLRHRSSNLSR